MGTPTVVQNIFHATETLVLSNNPVTMILSSRMMCVQVIVIEAGYLAYNGLKLPLELILKVITVALHNAIGRFVFGETKGPSRTHKYRIEQWNACLAPQQTMKKIGTLIVGLACSTILSWLKPVSNLKAHITLGLYVSKKEQDDKTLSDLRSELQTLTLNLDALKYQLEQGLEQDQTREKSLRSSDRFSTINLDPQSASVLDHNSQEDRRPVSAEDLGTLVTEVFKRLTYVRSALNERGQQPEADKKMLGQASKLPADNVDPVITNLKHQLSKMEEEMKEGFDSFKTTAIEQCKAEVGQKWKELREHTRYLANLLSSKGIKFKPFEPKEGDYEISDEGELNATPKKPVEIASVSSPDATLQPKDLTSDLNRVHTFNRVSITFTDNKTQ